MDKRKIPAVENIEMITSMISCTKERLAKGSGNILLMWRYSCHYRNYHCRFCNFIGRISLYRREGFVEAVQDF